ncbi:hypothetical protein CLV35_3685 [Motilibacter peucedani]|uniref:Uncharacterized protein n=1 Tax=Motilibacter peucedani TaxID=598650 RepID=A0A420XL46_9ACTN|nr:hypothetical protein [Motilibacter peucedani]RKS68557.1 hypothetical protein CLV35_3685 [Motilibacter peucedani]
MTDPRPRPAFRTGAGGTARPAPERLTSFEAQLPPARETTRDRPTEKPDKRPKKGKDEVVTLTVRLPRSLRKRLRSQAEAAGYTAEDATYHLIRSWLQR